MDCNEAMGTLLDSFGGEPIPFPMRARVWAHLFFCPRCAKEAEALESAYSALSADFFPPAPGLADSVMARLPADSRAEQEAESWEPAGVSTRSWVITGCIVFVSLLSVFFGLAFGSVADFHGTSFLLPVGITIGVVLSGYGALFIGSHLEELAARFKLR